MRLIDADALEELFREVIGGIAKRPEINGNLEHMIRASAMVVEMIKDAPTIEPEPHWIPCSERLPEPRTDVWCNSDLGQMSGFYDETTETWYRGDYFELLVNAWMPLPEPYQPEEESE